MEDRLCKIKSVILHGHRESIAPLQGASRRRSTAADFPCSGCGEIVRVMEKAVENTRQATCLKCGVPYKAEESENSFTFYPDQPPFTCDCGVSTFIPLAHVEIGYRFSCRGCKRTFETVECEWKYVPIEDTDPPESGG